MEEPLLEAERDDGDDADDDEQEGDAEGDPAVAGVLGLLRRVGAFLVARDDREDEGGDAEEAAERWRAR